MMMSSVMPKPKLQQMKAHSAKTCISAYWKTFAGAEIRARAAEKSRKKDKKLSRGRVHNNMKWKEQKLENTNFSAARRRQQHGLLCTDSRNRNTKRHVLHA